MSEIEKFIYLVGFACLISVLLCTSFVAMVMAKSVKANPSAFNIHQDLVDIVIKYSSVTFSVSAVLAVIVYLYGAILLIFHFAPALIAYAFG